MGVEVALVVAGVAVALLVDEVAGVVVSLNEIFNPNCVQKLREIKIFLGRGGAKTVVIEPHRHEGVFIARGKEDALVTLNMVPGEGVYGEKRVSVEEQDKGEFKNFVNLDYKLAP